MAVAAELGYTTPQFISNWERGISAPPLNVIAKLAALYSVSEQTLFDLLLKSTLERVEISMREEFKRMKKAT
ncbi:helix-turn-helix protein [compost metagenome]